MTQPETLLDEAIASAYTQGGEREAANRVWLALLKTPLYLAVDALAPRDPNISFQPLIAMVGEYCFLAAFDSEARFLAWAGEHAKDIQHVQLSGRDLLAGIGDNVFLALNPGTPFYKEISPDEMKHLKKIIARVDQLKEPEHVKDIKDSNQTDIAR